MQRVIHLQPNIHPIFNEIEQLYSITSEKSNGGLIKPVFDSSFIELVDLFRIYGGISYKIDFSDKIYPKLEIPQNSKKNIVVCYSGGKDSLATALHYKKLGYNVYLFHVTGINKTYYDEWQVAQQTAKSLGFNYHEEDVSYKGYCKIWHEHPMKNMIIANMAINYGIRKGIGTKIAFGNFYTSSLVNDDFATCAGDDTEMWNAYEKIIRRVIPNFKVYRPNKNYQTAFNSLYKQPELLEKTISCMTPNRFRNSFRERTIKKYNISLLPNRCGCCWKCAVEYIWFTDHGIFEYNEDYYNHCLEVLQNNTYKETGVRYPLATIWDQYFFYKRRKKYGIIRGKEENTVKSIKG